MRTVSPAALTASTSGSATGPPSPSNSAVLATPGADLPRGGRSRVADAQLADRVVRQATRRHVAANRPHGVDGVGEQWRAAVAGPRDLVQIEAADGLVHTRRVDAQPGRDLVVGEVDVHAGPLELAHLLGR